MSPHSLSLSLSHTHTHTHIHTHLHSMRPHTLSLPLARHLSLSHTHTQPLPISYMPNSKPRMNNNSNPNTQKKIQPPLPKKKQRNSCWCRSYKIQGAFGCVWRGGGLVWVCLRVYVYVCACVCVDIYVYVCLPAGLCVRREYLCFMCMCVFMVDVCLYEYVCVMCMCVFMSMCVSRGRVSLRVFVCHVYVCLLRVCVCHVDVCLYEFVCVMCMCVFTSMCVSFVRYLEYVCVICMCNVMSMCVSSVCVSTSICVCAGSVQLSFTLKKQILSLNIFYHWTYSIFSRMFQKKIEISTRARILSHREQILSLQGDTRRNVFCHYENKFWFNFLLHFVSFAVSIQLCFTVKTHIHIEYRALLIEYRALLIE